MEYAPKKMLAPVDFSDFSRQALRAAVRIGELWNAELTALHVIEDPGRFPGYMDTAAFTQSKADFQKDAERELDAMLQAAGAGLRVGKATAHGDPSNEIVRFAEKEAYDLIVMATHGRTGLGRLLLGSVTERVIRHAHCPVLSIRSVKAVLGEP